jgi:hypothetical protein
MRFISLDISSNIGWAYFEVSEGKLSLLERGQIQQVEIDKNLTYPESYLDWSQRIWDQIWRTVLVNRQFENIITEETSKGSKDAHSQKLLEWIHKHLAEYAVKDLKSNDGKLHSIRYLQTGEWRTTAGCIMTAEEKRRNKKVRTTRKRGEAEGKKVVLVEIAGEKVGLVGKKHVALRRVQEIFGIELMMKENDQADALLIGYAAFKRFFKI